MSAENKEIILDIKVKYEDALNKIGKLRTENDLLTASKKALKEEYKKGEITQGEYNKSLAATNIEYKQNATSIRALEKEVRNNIQYEKASIGSKEQLRAELALNVAAYDKLSEAERKSVKGSMIQKHMDETNVKLKTIEESYGDHRRSVGDYGKATVALRDRLKELTNEMIGMRASGMENTKEFKAMQTEAAKLKKSVDETNVALRNTGKGTANVEALNQGMQTLVGSYGLYASAMGVADKDNEKFSQTMKSLQIVMAALASAQAIQNALLKQNTLMTRLATFQTWAKTRADAAATKGTALGTIQQKIFNLVAAANPYVILAIALISVVGALAMFALRTNKATKEQQALNDVQRKAIDGYVDTKTEIESLSRTMSSSTATDEDKKAALKNLNENYLDLNHQLSTVKEAEQWLIDNKDALIEAMRLKAQAAAAYDLAVEANKKALEAMQKQDKEYVKWYGRILLYSIP